MLIDKYLEKIVGVYSEGYLFRGQSSEVWSLNSSAFRRLDNGKGCSYALFTKYNKDLIEQSKMRGYDIKESKKLSDIQIIGELQHFGAATCLIDFTENFLVALWFSCQSLGGNGVVFILRKDAMKEITSGNIGNPIDGFLSEENLYYWQPDNINNRIPAQSSVFVFGKPTLDNKSCQKIIVEREDKHMLLYELRTIFNITERALFPDLYGFATSQGQTKPLTDEIEILDILKHCINFKKWKEIEIILENKACTLKRDTKVCVLMDSIKCGIDINSFKDIFEKVAGSIGYEGKFCILMSLMKNDFDINPIKKCFSDVENPDLQSLCVMIFDGKVHNQKMLEKLFYLLLCWHSSDVCSDASPAKIAGYLQPNHEYSDISGIVSDIYVRDVNAHMDITEDGAEDTVKSFAKFLFESRYFSKEVKDSFISMMISYKRLTHVQKNEYKRAEEFFQFLESIEDTSVQK